MKKLFALLLAVLMVVGLFAGCNTNPEESKAPGNETPTDAPPWGNNGESNEETEYVAAMPADGIYFKTGLSMNNAENGLSSTFTGVGFHTYALFERLIAFNTDTMTWNGQLAEKWEVSDDGLLWTVYLKKDHKFTDGEPVTADDVVFTYNYAVKAGAYRTNLSTSIEGYDAVKAGEADALTGVIKVDDYTVQFKLAKANSLFIDTLGSMCYCILPQHLIDGKIEPTNFNDSEFWQNPVGSGYYKVGETKYPDYVVLVANTDYEKQPGCEKILCRNAGEGAWQAGETYRGANVSQENMELITMENTDVVATQPATTYRRYFEFNWSGKAGETTTHPSLSNAKVRQALGMLIDKEAITYLFGNAVALSTEINPNHYLYNTDIPLHERNVDEAKKILDAEGFDYSTPIRLYTDYTDQTTTDLFELVKQNFAEAGVTLEYKQDGNWELFFTAYDYDMVYNAGMSRNPIDFYNQMTIAGRSIYTCDYLPDDAAVEAMVKERYDDLVDAYLATVDTAEQKQILDQLQANAYEDCFRIPLYAVQNYNLINAAHVSGYPDYARDYEEIVDLQFENWNVK